MYVNDLIGFEYEKYTLYGFSLGLYSDKSNTTSYSPSYLAKYISLFLPVKVISTVSGTPSIT